jgi:Zn-dependent protease with chaperone function
MASPVPGQSPIGPADRTTFFEEQARNRRKATRFAVIGGLTVALTGIPLSILLTPVLFLITLIVAHLIQLARPLPPAFWDSIRVAGRLLPTVAQQIVQAVELRSLGPIDGSALGAATLVLVAPGMALMVLIWLWVRAVFGRAGTAGVLLRIGARKPDDRDLEERQLVNLIEEMALAGGVRIPQVMLLDLDQVNAAALGSSIEDSTIVVTRGLLRRLDRSETQGVIAHLVGSIGNGDLKILNLLFSVFQTFGLLGILLRAVASPGARRKLWRTFISFFRRGDGAEVERVASMLAANESTDEGATQGGCLTVLLMPLALVGMTIQLLTSLAAWLFFGPPLTALWRARRFLADASAIQLTRDPNGITRALQRMTECEVEFAEGRTSRILFIHWPAYVGGSSDLGQAGKFHPDLWKRISRLRASGGKLIERAGGGPPRKIKIPVWLLPIAWFFKLLISVIYLAAIVVMVGTGGFVAFMSLAIMGLALFAIQAFFENLPAIIRFVREDLPEIAKALWGLIQTLIANSKR